MPRPPPPLEAIRRSLSGRWDERLLEALPRAWTRLGDVLVLDVPPEWEGAESELGAAYARVLRARAVLAHAGRIEGELRLPDLRRVWGDAETETLHVENGVRYRFDPARVMWSPGNVPERQRVARWPVAGETVVDLFAGVGYFTLPVAVHGRPARIVAIEKNPVAHAYLEANVDLNGVAEIVEARRGDNRDEAPSGIADRVLMGYLPDASPFLPVAVRALRPEGGLLHYHCAVGADRFPFEEARRVEGVLETLGWRCRLHDAVRVKNYGPGKVHGVLDLEVRPCGS